ncbi:SirB2 family protein [Ferrimonas senticii]|uniref:SirB2 family protein n=1 Tax=Ferrimonas senticii TaxID=394566 RepID=UPI000418C114|nr:SirB2 family protein [Ferrimonas senticii]
MPYEALRHIHFTVIGISIALLALRYVLVMKDSPILQHKLLKVGPHVIDTVLLLSGLALMFISGITPFNSPWLAEKLLALVAYIILGVLIFKAGRGKLYRTFAFVGALGWLFYMAKLAVTKTPILFT